MRQHKLWLCTLLVLLLAALGAFGAAAETTVGMSGAGSFKMEQVYVNVPELDVYFYALDGNGNSYSPIKVQAAGPELTLGDRRLEVRSVAAASDPICYILALDNSKSIAPSEFYTMLGGVRKLINAMGDDDQLMLYTTAGSTECVLPATSDKNLMYKTLGSIKQVEGSMDTARLISAVYSELQSDYQALAPRLNGELIINLLPRTRLELTRVLMLLEQWVGPTTPYPVPGLRNVLLHTAPRYELASDL